MPNYRRAFRLAVLLAPLGFAGIASADPCKEMWQDGRAIHADLQRKAIEEINNKNYAGACKTMRELTRLGRAMQTFVQENCWANAAAKRRAAAADNIADRTKDICAQAEKR